MSMIELRDITLSYGEEAVLSGFNLTIHEGEFVTIIGSSGCGKTTALKLINGLLTPQRGSVFVENEDISQIDIIKLRRRIGYVIQDIGLFPHMTVEKNLAYVPYLEKKGNRDKQVIHGRILGMLQVIGLKPEMLKRYPDELSGGQRQRVGIGRALMASPKIILMDEPFGAVDEITRRKLQDEIIGIYKKMGCTIVFITHDISEALKLGTRVIVMDKGKIVQDGTPEEIRERPNTGFVKKLVHGEGKDDRL